MIESLKYQTSPDLISGLIEGDVMAFKKIYSSYFNRVFHFVCRFSLVNEDAEEIVQDVFIRLWEKRTSVDINKSLCSYLFAISQNMVIDKMRQYVATEKRMQKVKANGVNIFSAESTEELVNFYELSDIIAQLIDDLPTGRRTIFKLSREKCFTYKEIADILKISQGTVEKQMSKALHSLTTSLKSKYGLLIDLIVLFPFLSII